MKTILLNNKRLVITSSEERALRIIRKKKFVAKKDDFTERKSGNRFRSILPQERNWRGSRKQSARAERFFAGNPKCFHAVIGNVRRINFIMDKIESGDFG